MALGGLALLGHRNNINNHGLVRHRFCRRHAGWYSSRQWHENCR
jgi:hypothetical protein